MNVWDFWAGHYDRLWVQRVSLGPTRVLVTAEIGRLLKQNRVLRLLDVGCGTGQQYADLCKALGPSRIDYLGIDRSGAMIEQARQKYPEGRFEVIDVASYQPNTTVNAIICSHSFPYYPDGWRVLASMAAWLAPGGVLLLAQACTNTFFDRIVLAGVGITTGRARYRSVAEMQTLGTNYFSTCTTTRISKQFFIPSLYLFRWER